MSSRLEDELSEKILDDFRRIDEMMRSEAKKHAMNYRGEWGKLYKEFLYREWDNYLRSN